MRVAMPRADPFRAPFRRRRFNLVLAWVVRDPSWPAARSVRPPVEKANISIRHIVDSGSPYTRGIDGPGSPARMWCHARRKGLPPPAADLTTWTSPAVIPKVEPSRAAWASRPTRLAPAIASCLGAVDLVLRWSQSVIRWSQSVRVICHWELILE